MYKEKAYCINVSALFNRFYFRFGAFLGQIMMFFYLEYYKYAIEKMLFIQRK